jgi:predicted peptidase
MGAREGWRLATTNSERFPAVVPICGRRPDGVRSLDDTRPLCDLLSWIFHGAQDQVVPIEESKCHRCSAAGIWRQRPLQRLRRRRPRLVDTSVREPELYSWLLGQRRADVSSQQLVR